MWQLEDLPRHICAHTSLPVVQARNVVSKAALEEMKTVSNGAGVQATGLDFDELTDLIKCVVWGVMGSMHSGEPMPVPASDTPVPYPSGAPISCMTLPTLQDGARH